MPSIHVWKSIEKSKSLGGFAGDDAALPLWDLSKRELVEIATRLGATVSGHADSPVRGASAAIKEHETLKLGGIV